MHSNGETMDSPSPSFNSYFNTDLAEVVARVATEFTAVDDDDFFSNNVQNDEVRNEDTEGVEDDGGFEFNFLVPNDGEIQPVYPVFDRDLLREEVTSAQIQLNSLFLEERDADPPSASSSSEEEDVEEISHRTYCVWMPNKTPLASPGRCTKSKSTGSSAASATEKVKAWKLRDLLKRSKSDGKDQNRLVLLTPKNKAETPAGRGSVCSVATASAAGAGDRLVKKTAAREGNFIRRSTTAAEKNKRKSYLPYRQDLVGFSVSPRAVRKMHLLPL